MSCRRKFLVFRIFEPDRAALKRVIVVFLAYRGSRCWHCRWSRPASYQDNKSNAQTIGMGSLIVPDAVAAVDEGAG